MLECRPISSCRAQRKSQERVCERKMGSCVWSWHAFNPSAIKVGHPQQLNCTVAVKNIRLKTQLKAHSTCILQLQLHKPSTYGFKQTWMIRYISCHLCHISDMWMPAHCRLEVVRNCLDLSMAIPCRAMENTMRSISARMHQLVSEPFFPSPRSSADHQWQHPPDPQIHHPQPCWISSQHIDHHQQIKMRHQRRPSQIDQEPQQTVQQHSDLRSDDLIEKPCTKQQEASNLQGIEKKLERIDAQLKFLPQLLEKMKTLQKIMANVRSITLDVAQMKAELKAEMMSSPPSSPQDPKEIKTRGCDESIRDNSIRINEDLEEHSRESHTDFRSEVSVEKEQEASLWSMLKDYIRSEPLSSLQKCSEDLGYSYLIDQAYEWGKKNNDLLRMLKVGAFATSGSASTEEKVSHQPRDLLPRPRPPPQPPPKPPLQPLDDSPPKPTEIHQLTIHQTGGERSKLGHWITSAIKTTIPSKTVSKLKNENKIPFPTPRTQQSSTARNFGHSHMKSWISNFPLRSSKSGKEYWRGCFSEQLLFTVRPIYLKNNVWRDPDLHFVSRLWRGRNRHSFSRSISGRDRFQGRRFDGHQPAMLECRPISSCRFQGRRFDGRQPAMLECRPISSCRFQGRRFDGHQPAMLECRPISSCRAQRKSQEKESVKEKWEAAFSLGMLLGPV